MLIRHEMQVIKKMCDRVAVLERGEVLEQGPVFDITTSPTSATTRKLVRGLIDRELPWGLVERSAGGNVVIRIIFAGLSVQSPIFAGAMDVRPFLTAS